MTARTPQTDMPEHQRRNGIIVCLIGMIAFGVTIPSAYEPFTRSNSWEVYANLLSGLVPTLVWLIALLLVWRNRVEQGIQLGLIATLISIPATSYWSAGLGLTNAVAVGVSTTIAAGVCLSGARSRLFMILGVIAALAAIAIDSIAPNPRLIAEQAGYLISGVTGLGVLALIVFLFLQFPRYTLRTKLIILFVGLAILSTLAITLVATQASRTALSANAARDLRTRAQSAALSVGLTMDRNVDRMTALSLDKSVQDGVVLSGNIYPDDAAEREAVIQKEAARWGSADDQDPFVSNLLHGKLADSLRQFVGVFQGNREMLITDKYGSVIATTDRTATYNYSDESWWKTAYAGGSGGVYIGQPEFDPMLNQWGVRTAIPIFTPARDQVVGVLQGIYTLTALQRALLLNSFGETGKIDLLFPQGQILTSDGTFRPLTPAEFSEVQNGIDSPLATLSYRGTPLLSSQGVVGVSDEQPEPYLRSSAWRTIATIQSDEALGAVDAEARASLIAGIVTIALAVVIALVLAQLLTRPIRRLTAAAEQVQGGDLSARAPVETGDEIGTLARTFNLMTARLQDTLSGLEHRVAERTQELSDANLTLQSNSAYLSALSDTSAGLFERLDLTSLLHAVVERAGALMGTHNGFVFFAEPEAQEIEMRVGSGLYDDLVGTRAQRGVGLAGTVWQTGEPMVIEDYQKWEGRLPGSRRDALHAILAIPLKRGAREAGQAEDTIGVIGLAYTDEGRKFGKPEVQILQRFAQLASIALDNAELYANSENRVRELDALNTISQLIVQPYNFDNVVERIGDQIRTIFESDFGYFAIVNSETHLIEFPYVVDAGQRIHLDPLRLDEGITAQVINSGQPILLSHATPEDFERLGAVDSGDNTSPHSMLVVPIRSGAQILGALSVQRYAVARAFTTSDQNLLMTIAANIGVGLQNVQLAQATQRRLSELGALNTISSILTSDQVLNNRLAQVGRELHTIFGVSAVYVALYDAQTRQVRMPFFMGDAQEYNIEPFALGPGFTSHIIKTRQPLLINDGMEAQMQALHALNGGQENNSQSYLGVPMVLGDEILGVIGLSDVPKNKFQESDVRLLETIASAVATAIQNTRLLEQTQERARELDAVNSLAREITQQRSLDDLFQEVYIQVKSVSVADGLLVSLYDDQTDTLTVPFLMDEGKRYEVTPDALEFERGYIEQVRKGEPLMINNTPEEAAELDKSAAVAGAGRASRSRLYVPLMAGVRLLGMISLHSYEFNAYSERDVSVLSGLASYIAVALENARLFEQTQKALGETAAQAQRLSHLNQASADLAVATTFEGIIQITGAVLNEMLHPDRVSFSLLGADRTDFQIYGVRGDIGVSPVGTAFQVKGSLVEQAEYTGRVVYTPDISVDFDTPSMRPLIQQGLRSIVTAPFFAQGRVIGTVNVSSKTPNNFSERDVDLVVQLAALTGTTLEKLRLLEQTQGALAETNRLYRIAEAANLSLDEETFYKRMHEITREALPAENFFIALYNPEDATMDMVYYADQKDTLPDMPMRRLNLGDGITAYALRHQKPLMLTKAQVHALAEKGELQIHGGESEMWLGVPMMRGEIPLGVVAVQSYDPAVLYNERDKETMIHLAQGFANALERKRAEEALRTSQTQLAETMQLTRLGNWEYDVPTDTFTFNDRFYAMMRTTAEREGGYQMRSAVYAGRFVHPEDAPMVGQEIGKAIQTTDPNFRGALDHRVIFGDGKPGYVTVTFRVIKDPQGRTIKTYGANLDISERKQAEVDLQAALAETQRLAVQARNSAEQVTLLNRRLTREGWRDFLGELNSPQVYHTGDEEMGNGHAAHPATSGAPTNGDGANGHDMVRVPIMLRGEVIGEIELEQNEMEQGLSEDQQAIVNDVAEHLGIVLDNARLYQQSQVALDETRRLADREKRAAEISDRIYAATDVKAILRIASEELRKTTKSSRAVVKLTRDKPS